SICIDDKNSTQKIYGTDAIFELKLDANQTKTIYIKSTMNTMQYPLITIYSELNSKKRVSNNNLILSILLGMLIALSIYHAFLYITTRHKEYIYYALYLACASIWESIMAGVLANGFGIYMDETYEVFLTSILVLPLFLVLFAKSIFDTKTDYKTEDRFLNSIILFFMIDIGISIFDIQLALIISSKLYTYMFITLFITTYSIMRKGNPFALTFLLANAFFSLFMMITNLYYQGFINYTPFIFNAASIGVILEALVLSLLLLHKIKLLQTSEIDKTKELLEHIEGSREKDKILFQQNKLASMGEMIENIAHQWRQPLSQVNSAVLVIDNYLMPESKNYKEIDQKLTEIEDLTFYMSKTIDSFKNFFKPNKKDATFYVEDIINSSLLIAKNTIPEKTITIVLKNYKDDRYFGLEDELQQVLIIILNNAKEALVQNKIENPRIEIQTINTDDYYTITISDNAGGIDADIIDKIFDPYFTTKHKSQGTGLGLYISKLIIEENMHGVLTVQNRDAGSCFEIKLPLKESSPI
ncbi:MAG: 7TM diverse intracellular signaling domain-containing protein, partial [Campylobacterota bacterium]|nr:7TM diverse intracellular signaling domain-containing protein [Campylobacterota bacterium]